MDQTRVKSFGRNYRNLNISRRNLGPLLKVYLSVSYIKTSRNLKGPRVEVEEMIPKIC